ncbi:hypothetical protein NP493_1050g01019 [Ridgeia piscesae]|uniref:SUEL-type lectin domain-containing protein n=1 Tax=Ridgeia piscesae TaxID=27915 RepID=A0AAD9KI87_RIDPI|nr:hypothetical protein NP493_1050g01019 [Ridgeia piscesae]
MPDTTGSIAMPDKCHTIRAPPKSYCPNEVFKADCGRDRIVVMTTAMYGRMSEKSRCIRKNYGFVGCGSSVIGIADHFCSGRRSCEIPIPNSLVEDVKTACPEDFKSYLEAGYRCTDGELSSLAVTTH